MRLTLLIPSISEGGAARVLTNLANGWVDRGVTVSVVTLSGPEDGLYELDETVDRIALDVTEASPNLLVGVWRNLRRVRLLRSVLRRLSPDAAIAFLPRTSVLTVFAAEGTGVPVAVSEHSDPRRDPLPLVWRGLRRLAYRGAHALVVQTDGVASWARKWLPAERVHVIPNPVLPPDPAARQSAETVARSGVTAGRHAEMDETLRAPASHAVVGMGRLVPAKGFDLLVRAFARCSREHPAWSLVILGEGPERRRLERLADDLGVAPRVMLPGRVSSPWHRLDSAELFVLSSRYEGFGNVLVEAMARGIASVSFDCPTGPGEIITHDRDGLLVPAEDVGALAAAMDRLMDSPGERRKLGERARDVLDRYGVDRVLDQWEEIIPPEESG